MFVILTEESSSFHLNIKTFEIPFLCTFDTQIKLCYNGKNIGKSNGKEVII
jgi:hypothetical protein